MKILYSSEEVRKAIINVLKAPQAGDRRVVMVAYVGGMASQFLPSPKGLEVVCWLQPGATDAQTLARLADKGANIFKSDRLHMKVYWSSRCGCVITSANASGQALAGGMQKEAGVLLPPNVVQIDRLWEEASPERVRGKDLARLALETERAPRAPGVGPAPPPVGFLEWKRRIWRRKWKLAGWRHDPNVVISDANRAALVNTFGINEPYQLIDFPRNVRKDEWYLTFRLRNVNEIQWFCVDYKDKVLPTDTEAYIEGFEYQAVQCHELKTYPFKLDAKFRKAFRIAINAQPHVIERIDAESIMAAPKALLDSIEKHYPT